MFMSTRSTKLSGLATGTSPPPEITAHAAPTTLTATIAMRFRGGSDRPQRQRVAAPDEREHGDDECGPDQPVVPRQDQRAEPEREQPPRSPAGAQHVVERDPDGDRAGDRDAARIDDGEQEQEHRRGREQDGRGCGPPAGLDAGGRAWRRSGRPARGRAGSGPATGPWSCGPAASPGRGGCGSRSGSSRRWTGPRRRSSRPACTAATRRHRRRSRGRRRSTSPERRPGGRSTWPTAGRPTAARRRRRGRCCRGRRGRCRRHRGRGPGRRATSRRSSRRTPRPAPARRPGRCGPARRVRRCAACPGSARSTTASRQPKISRNRRRCVMTRLHRGRRCRGATAVGERVGRHDAHHPQCVADALDRPGGRFAAGALAHLHGDGGHPQPVVRREVEDLDRVGQVLEREDRRQGVDRPRAERTEPARRIDEARPEPVRDQPGEDRPASPDGRHPSRSRARTVEPTTRSAPPASGARTAGMNEVSCWPSPSICTTADAPSSCA